MAHCERVRCQKTASRVEDREVCLCDCDECAETMRADVERAEEEREQRRRNRSEAERYRQTYAEDRPQARSPSSWWTPTRVGLLLLAIGGAAFWWNETGGFAAPPMQVKCLGSGASATCSVENLGGRAGAACWDAIAECDDGTHRSHACSGEVPAHATQSFTMPSFSPPIGEHAGTCKSFRVDVARK